MFSSESLTFAYSGRPAMTFPDARLGAGDRILVLGPSGSGKSTLLGLWAGLLTPKRGTVELAGVRPHDLTPRGRDRWRGRNVGLVFQQPRLLASQTIGANVLLPRRLAGLPTWSPAQLRAQLAALGIAHLAGSLPGALSVGERQRAGIARALATEPVLLLADEPTSALDRVNAQTVAELLVEHAAARAAGLIVVTHDDRLRPFFEQTLQLAPS